MWTLWTGLALAGDAEWACTDTAPTFCTPVGPTRPTVRVEVDPDARPGPRALNGWVVSRAGLDHLPAGRDVGRVLRAVPGVVPIRETLRIGGEDASRVTWQVDGVDLLPQPVTPPHPTLASGLPRPR